MSEELKPCEHGRNFCMDYHHPKGKLKTLPAMYDGLAAENQRLRTELAALKAGQGEVMPYAYEYGKDNGDGSYSVTITRGQIPSYLTPVKDWPIKPLYTAPPASADAVSVPREMAARLCSTDNHVRQTARRELRNMLVAQGVKP